MQISLLGRCISRYLFRTKLTWYSDMKANQKSNETKMLPLLSQTLLPGNNICIQDYSGQCTYSLLHYNSKRLSRQISNICGSRSSSTVGIFCSHDILTILTIWASWMSGQKVLVLDRGLPYYKLQSLAKETKVRLMISSDLFEKQSKRLSFENDIPLIHVDSKFLYNNFQNKMPKNLEMLNTAFYDAALISYGKGNVTTLTTHEELCVKMNKVLKSLTLTKTDKILYMCPSFNQYNQEFIFNLYFPLKVGSQFIIDSLDSKAAWQIILGLNIPSKDRVNVLIAEPKVYQQLIDEYEQIFEGNKNVQEHIRRYCLHNIRFMFSCFYSIDPKTSSTWYKITGFYLKESHSAAENTSQNIQPNNINAQCFKDSQHN